MAISLTLWENVYNLAKEELEALKLRKNHSPNTHLIEIQIRDVESRMEEAKRRLIKTY